MKSQPLLYTNKVNNNDGESIVIIGNGNNNNNDDNNNNGIDKDLKESKHKYVKILVYDPFNNRDIKGY